MTEIPKPPSNIGHLRMLLTEWSKRPDAEIVGRLQRLVGVVAIVSMLDGLRDADGRERIGYKGGSALELRFGFMARASKDLDAAFRGDLDEALELVGGAVARGWNGFTGTISDPLDVTRGKVSPPPFRIEVKLQYRDKPFMTIPLEISGAEGASLDQLERLPAAVSLALVRIPDPDEITFLPIRYQIAQKLHACTDPLDGDRINDRARDIWDLLLIKELAVGDEDLGSIRSACQEIFASRGKHEWPPVVEAPPGWGLLWDRLLESEEGLSISLEDAVAAANAFIASIEAAA
jgi:Nucleotidyl transferase AbiEii toxin, Type IV TA system